MPASPPASRTELRQHRPHRPYYPAYGRSPWAGDPGTAAPTHSSANVSTAIHTRCRGRGNPATPASPCPRPHGHPFSHQRQRNQANTNRERRHPRLLAHAARSSPGWPACAPAPAAAPRPSASAGAVQLCSDDKNVCFVMPSDGMSVRLSPSNGRLCNLRAPCPSNGMSVQFHALRCGSLARRDTYAPA